MLAAPTHHSYQLRGAMHVLKVRGVCEGATKAHLALRLLHAFGVREATHAPAALMMAIREERRAKVHHYCQTLALAATYATRQVG